MAKNYGDNPPLSYNKYLRVQDLINLQDCLSDPVHHDELLFKVFGDVGAARREADELFDDRARAFKADEGSGAGLGAASALSAFRVLAWERAHGLRLYDAGDRLYVAER